MKIIASDYDGTLRRGHGIDEKDRKAIKEWRDNGNLFGIVTGRGHDMSKTVAEENLEVDFIIVYNGTDIYSYTKNSSQVRLVKRLLGETDRFYELLPLILRKSGDWAEFVTPDKNYYLTYNDENANSKENWVKNEVLKEVKQFIQIYSLYDSEEEAMEIARRLNESYSDSVSALVNVRWLNVAPSGVTKATGVWEYAKIMSVAKEDIYTIGDSYNDFDMIKEFNGFTVENGAEGIKNIAREVYSGVWELINAFNKPSLNNGNNK